MRKFLMLFGFFCLVMPVISKAQVISTLLIQYSNPGINNNIEVIARVGVPYVPGKVVNQKKWVSNDTLYLTACYFTGSSPLAIWVTDTFQVGTLNPGSYKLYFKAFRTNTLNFCDSSNFTTRTQGFLVTNPLGIKPETFEAETLFYPNPATDFLHINNNSIKSIAIRDLTGKTIKNFHFQTEEAVQLNIHSIKPGLYLVEIADRNGRIFTQKLLKN